MPCLVTGGTGFLGRFLIREMRSRGLEVLLFARSTSDTREAEELGCRVFRGDLRHFETVREAMAKSRDVIHVGEIGLSEKNTTRRNVELVQVMLDAAQNIPGFRRFVLAGSITVVCPPQKTPADEDTPPRVLIRDNYTTYKRDCDEALKVSGLPCTVVRGSTIYGPGAHYLLWFAKWLRRTRWVGLPFPGAPDAKLPLIHVEDLAGILTLAYLQDAGGLKVFNAVDEEACGVRDFVSLMSRELGVPLRLLPVPLGLQRLGAWRVDGVLGLFGLPPNARGILDFLSHDNLFTNERMKRELGVDLRYPTIREGLPETMAWIAKEWK